MHVAVPHRVLRRLAALIAAMEKNLTGDDQVSMLALVEPSCYMCKLAVDEMQDVHDRVTKHGVKYYLVSFLTTAPASDFFNYTDSLGIDAPAFLWEMTEGKPPAKLLSMVTRSHLLVDRSGVILRTWPGANSDEATRERMANQIVSETLDEQSR